MIKLKRPELTPDEPAPPRDPAASMSLINDVIRHPLDPSYEAEAAKRRASGAQSRPMNRSPLLILTMILIGFGLATSAMALRVPLGVAEKQHDELVTRINAGQKLIDQRSGTVKTLNADIARLQESALQRGNRTGTTDDLREAEAIAGAVAVKGSGFVLTVSDAKNAGTDAQGDPRTSGSDTGRVTSSDLQIVVNGLWQAGAEAISINGQRITSLTAVRFAGQAILVNFRPLVPPYAISVIGPGSIKANFEKNAGGNYLSTLSKGVGITSKFETDKSITIPAAPSVSLNHARALKENQ